MTVSDIVDNATLYLLQQDLPGVALLEPLHFGARRIVARIEQRLRASAEDALIVRLRPNPNSNDEKRLYGALYRDLRAGLKQELGDPLPRQWQNCFSPSHPNRIELLEKKLATLRERWERATTSLTDLDERYLNERHVHEKLRLRDLSGDVEQQQVHIEQQLQELEQKWEELNKEPADEEAFELLLSRLLEGPIANENRRLILIVEGLSRVAEDHLKSWAWLMSRLTGQYPLKLLVWGGQELHELCAGTTTVEDTSPFQQLRQIRIGVLSAVEVMQLVLEKTGSEAGSAMLYKLTGGHPALIYEVLEQGVVDELRSGNEDALQARVLASGHLKLLRQRIEHNDEMQRLLQRFSQGDMRQFHSIEEDRLHWLGMIKVNSANWNFVIPASLDWIP